MNCKYFIINNIAFKKEKVAIHISLHLRGFLTHFFFVNGYYFWFDYYDSSKTPITEKYKSYRIPETMIILNIRHEDNKFLRIKFNESDANDLETRANDLEKMMDLTKQSGVYKYGLGIYCELNEDEAKLTYLIDGNRVDL